MANGPRPSGAISSCADRRGPGTRGPMAAEGLCIAGARASVGHRDGGGGSGEQRSGKSNRYESETRTSGSSWAGD